MFLKSGKKHILSKFRAGTGFYVRHKIHLFFLGFCVGEKQVDFNGHENESRCNGDFEGRMSALKILGCSVESLGAENY